MGKLDKIKLTGKVLLHSAKAQLTHPDTLQVATMVGLLKGLGGSFKTGLKSGIVTAGVMTVVHGITNVDYGKIAKL